MYRVCIGYVSEKRGLKGISPLKLAGERKNNNNNNSAGEQHTPAAGDDRIVFGIINKQEK
jgi:hypothetical protein